MSRFNTLYHGEPNEAADTFDSDEHDPDPGELRAALTNALRRIAVLEREAARNRKSLEE